MASKLTQLQQAYLELLLEDPNITVRAAAEATGADPSTIRLYRKDPLFVAEWRKRVVDEVVRPDHLHLLMRAVREKALSAERERDALSAAELYLKMADRMAPREAADMAGASTEALLEHADPDSPAAKLLRAVK